MDRLPRTRLPHVIVRSLSIALLAGCSERPLYPEEGVEPAPVWDRTHDVEQLIRDNANDLVIAADGDIYVVGSGAGGTAHTDPASQEISGFAAAFDRFGALLWTEIIDGTSQPGSTDAIFQAALPDPTGGVWAGGAHGVRDFGVAEWKPWLVHYTAEGDAHGFDISADIPDSSVIQAMDWLDHDTLAVAFMTYGEVATVRVATYALDSGVPEHRWSRDFALDETALGLPCPTTRMVLRAVDEVHMMFALNTCDLEDEPAGVVATLSAHDGDLDAMWRGDDAASLAPMGLHRFTIHDLVVTEDAILLAGAGADGPELFARAMVVAMDPDTFTPRWTHAEPQGYVSSLDAYLTLAVTEDRVYASGRAAASTPNLGDTVWRAFALSDGYVMWSDASSQGDGTGEISETVLPGPTEHLAPAAGGGAVLVSRIPSGDDRGIILGLHHRAP